MSLLDRFEQRIDRLVNGAFAKAFEAEVQPVEIAAALEREASDRAAVVSRDRTVVPNSFIVDLAPVDFERLSVHGQTLCDELADLVRQYCEEQHYTLPGPPEVEFTEDDELDTGVFRVRSRTRAAVVMAHPESAPQAAVRPPATTHAASTHAGTGTVIVHSVEHRPRLVIAGRNYPLTQPTTRIGRGTDVDIRIDDPGVSRHHAEISLGDEVTLRDLGSTNGTYVDGEAVRVTTLYDGAEVRLGTTVLEFRTG